MRIIFERSGGFTGLTRTVELDTASLPSDEAHNMRKLVQTAGFFELPAQVRTTGQSADDFQYAVTVEAEGKQHTVRTTGTAVPDALRPLIEHLTRVAKEKRRTPARLDIPAKED
jgi:hypothetical protein